jgi:hypothetical protein
MRDKGNIYLHIIDESDNRIIGKKLVSSVPRPNDELRMGGEIYYKVNRVVWVYDELDNPFERVNIGAELAT